MKMRMKRGKGYIELSYYDPENAYGSRVVVAAMTLFEGTGCWMVSDWRLSEHKVLSPYSASLNADDCCARYKPRSPAERSFVLTQLREVTELPDGTLQWCTFDNFYRGQLNVKGYRPEWRSCHDSGYFGYAEAFAKLKEIQAFWESFEGDPASARIDNPDRQWSESRVRMACLCKEAAAKHRASSPV